MTIRSEALLDQEALERGLVALADMDADLREAIARHGAPPLWEREPGFSTLLRIILEQQVSLASARATYERSLADGSFDLVGLEKKDDDEARAELTRLRGVGIWSADIYLLMALRRSDVWPRSDLALATAAAEVKQLERRPSPDELEGLASAWRPWRAVAARILWHHYLSTRHRHD